MEKHTSPHEFTLECIYEALLQLMQTKPFEDISVTDITRKAGVSRMAFYRNYKRKEDILLSHMRLQAQFLAASVTNPAELLQGNFWYRYLTAMDNLNLFRSVIDAGLFWETFQIHKEVMQDIYTRVFGIDLTDEQSLRGFYRKIGLVLSDVIFRMEHPELKSLEELASDIQLICSPEFPVPQL